LRPGRAGAARQAVHEDHFSGAGGVVAVRIRKNDTVLVIAGRDKGARGKVIAALPKEDKVIVEGVNRVKKHTRIRSTQRGAKTGAICRRGGTRRVPRAQRVDAGGKPTGGGSRLETVERPEGRMKTTRARVSRKRGRDI